MTTWVFSFHHGPAAELFARRKRFEFRRGRAHVEAGDRILVYEVKKPGKVTGMFTVGAVFHGSPAAALRLADPATAAAAAPYLDGAEVATALEVKDPTRFVHLDLSDASGLARAPQSYARARTVPDLDAHANTAQAATPGLEAGGIAIFEDGPAQSAVWSAALGPGRARMARLPWFLRIVSGDATRLDYLDLLQDDLEEGEQLVTVYRQRTWWHGRGEGFGAAYVEVPDIEPVRCITNEAWHRYVDEVLAVREWPAFGGGGEVFACRR